MNAISLNMTQYQKIKLFFILIILKIYHILTNFSDLNLTHLFPIISIKVYLLVHLIHNYRLFSLNISFILVEYHFDFAIFFHLIHLLFHTLKSIYAIISYFPHIIKSISHFP